MFTEITKIEYPKVTVKKDGKENIYEVEDQVKESFFTTGPAEVTFNDRTQKISFIRMEQSDEELPDPNKPKKSKWEDDMVKFEDLLTAAHIQAKKEGFTLNIVTDVVRDGDKEPMINLAKKFAFFRATVYLKKGDKTIHKFVGHGDTTDENVKGEHIKPHFIRMAETRAIVRALRWYTNNGCAEEEK